MFQPAIKLEFVRRYCNPKRGWKVFVHIDRSEEGRTGGLRTTEIAKLRQSAMGQEAERVKGALRRLQVLPHEDCEAWCSDQALAPPAGRRDIFAFHSRAKVYLVVEVEGESSGQPEQKIARAIEQIVREASEPKLRSWKRELVLVAEGEKLSARLETVAALERLGISALALGSRKRNDRWVFGRAPGVLRAAGTGRPQ